MKGLNAAVNFRIQSFVLAQLLLLFTLGACSGAPPSPARGSADRQRFELVRASTTEMRAGDLHGRKEDGECGDSSNRARMVRLKVRLPTREPPLPAVTHVFGL